MKKLKTLIGMSAFALTAMTNPVTVEANQTEVVRPMDGASRWGGADVAGPESSSPTPSDLNDLNKLAETLASDPKLISELSAVLEEIDNLPGEYKLKEGLPLLSQIFLGAGFVITTGVVLFLLCKLSKLNNTLNMYETTIVGLTEILENQGIMFDINKKDGSVKEIEPILSVVRGPDKYAHDATRAKEMASEASSLDRRRGGTYESGDPESDIDPDIVPLAYDEDGRLIFPEK